MPTFISRQDTKFKFVALCYLLTSDIVEYTISVGSSLSDSVQVILNIFLQLMFWGDNITSIFTLFGQLTQNSVKYQKWTNIFYLKGEYSKHTSENYMLLIWSDYYLIFTNFLLRFNRITLLPQLLFIQSLYFHALYLQYWFPYIYNLIC